MSGIEEYLNMLADANFNDKQTSYFKWLLEEGKSYTTKDECEVNKKEKDLMKKYGQARACYYNSQMIAMKHSEYKYVEGFYIVENIPISLEHAFLLKDGKIFDPTAFNNGRGVVDALYNSEIKVGLLIVEE